MVVCNRCGTIFDEDSTYLYHEEIICEECFLAEVDSWEGDSNQGDARVNSQ